MLEIWITSSVLILLICLLRITLKGKMNLKVQYGLWLIVVIRLFPIPLIPGIEVHPMESTISVMNLVDGLFHQKMNLTTNQTKNTINQDSVSSALVEQESEEMQLTLDRGENSSFASIEPKHSIYKIAIMIWFLGMIVGVLWFLYTNLRFRKYLLLNRKNYELEHSFVPVYVVDGLKTPCIFMIHRKYGIYITKEVSINKQQLNHVMLHEYCHYRHFDHIWSFVRCFLLIFYWYHPLVWIAAVISKRDAELACDAAAIEQLEQKERLKYGKTLVDIAASRYSSNVLCLGNGMAESKRGLKERIQCIIEQPKMMATTCVVVILFIGILIGSTFTTSIMKEKETISKENDELFAVDTIGNDLEPQINEGADKSLESAKSDVKVENSDAVIEEGKGENLNTDIEDKVKGDDLEVTSETLNAMYSFLGLDTDSTSMQIGTATINMAYNNYGGLSISIGDLNLSDLTAMKQIYSMKDITEQAVIKGASTYYKAVKQNMSPVRYYNNFEGFTGIDHYLTITTEEECSLKMDYESTASIDDFKLALQFPDDEVVFVDPNTNDTYVFPKGVSYVVLCGYQATGRVSIGFEEVVKSK